LSEVDLIDRIRNPRPATGELDWSLVHPDFEMHDHELPDSITHYGREGFLRWSNDWAQAFTDFSLTEVDRIDLGEGRVLTVHRLKARGRVSGVELERTDAQLWTFREGGLARMDYYPNYDEQQRSWASPATGRRSEI